MYSVGSAIPACWQLRPGRAIVNREPAGDYNPGMKFSIRDVLWLTVVVALAVGWGLDRVRIRRAEIQARRAQLMAEVARAEADLARISLQLTGPPQGDPPAPTDAP